MRHFLLVTVVVSLSLLMASPASSADAAIENVVITREGELLISFEVVNVFTREVEEAIASGIPTTLAFTVELHRKRRLWFDGAIVKRHFRHTVEYDTLREEYSVLREEKGVERMIAKSLTAAQTGMTRVDELQLISMGELKRGNSYRVTLQAERNGAHLPFPLNRILFFYSLGRFKTEIHEEGFVYE